MLIPLFLSSPCSLSPPPLQIEEDFAPRCEYCGSLLKPFPSFEDIWPLSQDYESVSWWERLAEVGCGKAHFHGTAFLPFRSFAVNIIETSMSSL